jgi:hypothetical protein
MTSHANEWADTLIHLLGLAARLEDEGQYNIAKLARAAADAMGRQAAYQISTPTDPTQFPAELRRAAGRSSALGVSPALLAALETGASALYKDRDGHESRFSENEDIAPRDEGSADNRKR